MQGRSWMAAWTVGLTLGFGVSPLAARGGDQPGQADDATSVRAVESRPHTIKLELRIAGLLAGGPGCDVDIKPGHPGCTFRPVLGRHVSPSGVATLVLNDVRTRSADRDCTFAITIREPGQVVRTVHRGLRLNPDTGPGQVLTCNVTSPSRIARTQAESGTRKR